MLRSRIRMSRFAAECRLWVQLGEHPNIVRAHSVEIIDGRPYVVLELIQGGELSRWIGTPRLDLLRALQFGHQFCLGMEHALRQGLHCHRDIKPGNLLVTEDGTLKITDFGLARVSEEMVAVRTELPDGSIPLSASTDDAGDHLDRPTRRDYIAANRAESQSARSRTDQGITVQLTRTRRSANVIASRSAMKVPLSSSTTTIPLKEPGQTTHDPQAAITVARESGECGFSRREH